MTRIWFRQCIVLFFPLFPFCQLSIATVQATATDFHTESQARHLVQVIENGRSSLYLRLKLIDKAKESVDLESFKYAPDRSGRLLNQALIRKAREGVTVRVLLDYYGSVSKSGFDKKYAQFLINAGVKIRFYNPSSLLRPRKLLYRNHRKTIIIDGKELLLGGRNQLDRFFKLDPKLHRFDREVYVTGPIVKHVRNTFDQFWNSKFTRQIPRFTHKKSKFISNLAINASVRLKNSHGLKVSKISRFFTENDRDKQLLNQIAKLGSPCLDSTPVFIVDRVEYISDTPKFSDRGRVKAYVHSLIGNAENNIFIESLFFIPQRKEKNIFKELLQSNVSVSLLTNSLFASTDHISVKLGYDQSAGLIEQGLKFYAYTGSPLPKETPSEKMAGCRWSIHSKTIVIDQRHVIEGSFNFSPRAGNFDAEHIMLFYDFPELAKYVENQIHSRLEGAKQAEENNRFVDGTKLNVNLTSAQKFFTLVSTFLFRPFISIL